MMLDKERLHAEKQCLVVGTTKLSTLLVLGLLSPSQEDILQEDISTSKIQDVHNRRTPMNAVLKSLF